MEKEINEILKCIDEISTKGRHSEFSEEFQTSVSEQSKIVSNYLEITSERQSILWSLLFSMSIQKNCCSIDLDDFSSFLDTTVIKVLLYQKDFDELVKRKLLRRHKGIRRRRRSTESLNYMNLFVPNDIIESLVNGETTLPKRRKKDLSVYEILDIVIDLLRDRDHEELDYDELCIEIERLIEENKDNSFIKQVVKCKLPLHEQIILLYVCQQFTRGNSSVDLIQFLNLLFTDTQSELKIRKEFFEEKTKLQHPDIDLIELESDSFKSDRCIQLTTKGKSLFGEDQNLFIDQEIKNQRDIILSSSIQEQKLFFNEKEQKSLNFLYDLLRPDNYNSMKQRMLDLGKKSISFTVLFHGFPGTGKSESVYQISRITGRDIKRINISETKSKWFGESEKLIKRVFDSYRRLEETSEVTPILFFDEVDGIFGTRKTVGNSSIDQTENTIQSIILSELSDFQGIMLSTTNLPKNLDKGFERRFLYKIFFDKPNSETRFLIWKDKLPILTDGQIRYLSETFEMSGGQIDNVVKKIVLNQILKGTTPYLNEIEEFCEEEFLERKTDRNKIGFRIGCV
jgi:hypothetical protein